MNDIGEEVNLQEKVRKEKPFERLGGNLNAFGAKCNLLRKREPAEAFGNSALNPSSNTP